MTLELRQVVAANSLAHSAAAQAMLTAKPIASRWIALRLASLVSRSPHGIETFVDNQSPLDPILFGY
ncbi:hypothetical protein J7E62_25550, partial [Variovorax paradoxus]|nr:hypothetical protein [Variovorax paradoxus]